MKYIIVFCIIAFCVGCKTMHRSPATSSDPFMQYAIPELPTGSAVPPDSLTQRYNPDATSGPFSSGQTQNAAPPIQETQNTPIASGVTLGKGYGDENAFAAAPSGTAYGSAPFNKSPNVFTEDIDLPVETVQSATASKDGGYSWRNDSAVTNGNSASSATLIREQ